MKHCLYDLRRYVRSETFTWRLNLVAISLRSVSKSVVETVMVLVSDVISDLIVQNDTDVVIQDDFSVCRFFQWIASHEFYEMQ
mmetsp:Transcript_30417/g.50530  ORF Transcript_30417/g.50530 Transcript_30417/m.50530 type:complete len:83 (-) Transcript_30417:31-279(-)